MWDDVFEKPISYDLIIAAPGGGCCHRICNHCLLALDLWFFLSCLFLYQSQCETIPWCNMCPQHLQWQWWPPRALLRHRTRRANRLERQLKDLSYGTNLCTVTPVSNVNTQLGLWRFSVLSELLLNWGCANKHKSGCDEKDWRLKIWKIIILNFYLNWNFYCFIVEFLSWFVVHI